MRAEYRSLFPAAAPDVGSKGRREVLLQAFMAQLQEWKAMLQKFLKGDDDQVGPSLAAKIEHHYQFC